MDIETAAKKKRLHGACDICRRKKGIDALVLRYIISFLTFVCGSQM